MQCHPGVTLIACTLASRLCRFAISKQIYIQPIPVFLNNHHGQHISLIPIFLSSLCPVPCGPKVNADFDCRSQVLTLGWNATSNAEGYITVISNSSEKLMTYNTSEPALRVNTLECGRDYMLKVMSYNGTCVSWPSVLPVSQSKRVL